MSGYNQPYGTGGGYPGQQPGYGGAYPGQQPGYGGQQPGYGPQPGGYPGSTPYGGQQQPGGYSPYPPASAGGAPMPQPGASIGFAPVTSGGPGYPGAGAPGYPSAGGPGYPPQSGYGSSAPGYPPQSGYGPSPGGAGYPMGQQPGGAYGPGVGAPAYNPTGYNPSSFPTGPFYHHQQVPGMQFSNPSLKPYPAFNAQHDAETLRNAMKGLGCNNSKVVQVLCARTNAQRQEIARVFKTMYGKDLQKELKSELRGDFEELILALMELPVNYDAQQLYKAMARIGTRENVLIEVMTTRSNAQIFQLKHAYKQIYGRDLEHDLTSETSGYFKRLLVSMCAGGRDESNATDPLRANQDARKLYRAGEQRLGTDEAQFSAILAAQNFAQLRLVFDEYQKVTGHSIEQAIQNEFSGDIRDAHLAVVKSIRNRAAYFAELLYHSMAGLGTRDTDLIRIIVTRSEVDLADIRNEYQRLYGKSLESAIAGDCSGAYKEGLMALVRGN